MKNSCFSDFWCPRTPPDSPVAVFPRLSPKVPEREGIGQRGGRVLFSGARGQTEGCGRRSGRQRVVSLPPRPGSLWGPGSGPLPPGLCALKGCWGGEQFAPHATPVTSQDVDRTRTQRHTMHTPMRRPGPPTRERHPMPGLSLASGAPRFSRTMGAQGTGRVSRFAEMREHFRANLESSFR